MVDRRRQYPAARHIVPETEAARETENLEPVGQRGVFQKPVDMNALGLGACQFKGIGGLDIAVGAGRAENQNVRFCIAH